MINNANPNMGDNSRRADNTRRLSGTGSSSSMNGDALTGGRSGRIRILAPSGDHFEMPIRGMMRINDLRAEIFDSWPKELLHEERPESEDCLRFLYQGRFQEPRTLIKDLPQAFEEMITIHLFISPSLQAGDEKGTEAGCCPSCCIS